jgi:5-(carboxyamino)imidazole ribonucleotide synthase
MWPTKTARSSTLLLPRRAALATLGIVGGGQLAKMTAQAATQLGCEVAVFERGPEFPAQALDTRRIHGDWDDPRKVLELTAEVDVVTLENEFVASAALEAVERAGHLLRPGDAAAAGSARRTPRSPSPRRWPSCSRST